MARAGGNVGRARSDFVHDLELEGMISVREVGASTRIRLAHPLYGEVLADSIIDDGARVVSGGTENHLMLVDLIGKDYTGTDADAALVAHYYTADVVQDLAEVESFLEEHDLHDDAPAG